MTATRLEVLRNADYLALRLRARREELGLTQRAVAGLIGTRQSRISEWEHGQDLGVSSAERWADALGLRLQCELHERGPL